ncbi:MAG: hypothetical protein JWM06_2821 [Actinomycetia bacterium]|nr:hypothetical protein [Actinomycetes bacterium]
MAIARPAQAARPLRPAQGMERLSLAINATKADLTGCRSESPFAFSTAGRLACGRHRPGEPPSHCRRPGGHLAGAQDRAGDDPGRQDYVRARNGRRRRAWCCRGGGGRRIRWRSRRPRRCCAGGLRCASPRCVARRGIRTRCSISWRPSRCARAQTARARRLSGYAIRMRRWCSDAGDQSDEWVVSRVPGSLRELPLQRRDRGDDTSRRTGTGNRRHAAYSTASSRPRGCG